MVPDVLGRPHPLCPDRLKNIRDYSATEWCATGLGPRASYVHLIHHSNAADIKKHGIKYHKYADDIQLYASYNSATPGDQVETARRLKAILGKSDDGWRCTC